MYFCNTMLAEMSAMPCHDVGHEGSVPVPRNRAHLCPNISPPPSSFSTPLTTNDHNGLYRKCCEYSKEVGMSILSENLF